MPAQSPIPNLQSPLSYDFANILFAGPCNACCPFCIGQRVDPRLNVPNLRHYPPANLDEFVEMIRHFAIRQLVFTGTTTDPQIYRHEARLLDYLRGELHPESQFSLHTNGRLALRKWDVFNSYDRVCLSFPSFDEATYRRVMGVPVVPDLAEILRRATVPVKVSCVVTEANRGEIPGFLRRCQAIGIERLVLRKLYGEKRAWTELLAWERLGLSYRSDYRANPVYALDGMEVTLWDFDETQSRSLNLFADGTISSAYRLVEAIGAAD
ncbi:MAG: radical SAM protein [Caldilineaceae bacterium]|nr:radical SAM protein [Caldilineaceae bacterium]